ncbi:multicopper oxidase family protein [Sphingomicrobium sediminis]|uniref:Multicopper oxidase domain-containing protein n=1 Tax=Sphingomicrobium sediminis TaxID=2950949 RepID=A0A9X2J4M4_9SPHN|nr:multicopper oxidase domain-containing protein [Sphingomicrobium sediminis]MCM8558521.1 multicopper oxidase domain-containing protein [Sphingomicrobium sediminis]
MASASALGAGNAATVEPASPSYEVSVEFAEGEIYNPWTGRNDKVELRAFRGEGNDRFMAPELRVSPGQVLRLGVANNLAPCTPEEVEREECFNSTNIHTHGLWVSPGGNSDNVMISIDPGHRFDYEFVIPDDHPAGTFWYHPHMHGATSAQLGSGMAGALIIEGDRLPTIGSPGDVDILFGQGESAFGEQVLLFSQIQYGCFDDTEKIKAPAWPDPDTRPWELPPWTCDEGDVGKVSSWDQFGPLREMTSGRLIGVNGEVQPTLSGLSTGRFQRLRMIHAGLRRSVNVSIRRVADGAPALRGITAHEQRGWISNFCSGDEVAQFHFADDGLTRNAMREVDEAVIHAGSRYDSLVYFEQPGLYCMVNDQSWRMDHEDHRVIGILDVGGEAAPVDNVASHLMHTLREHAEMRIDDQRVRERVIGDLSGELGLSAFTWHEAVRDDEITGYQQATFSIVEQEDSPAILSIDGLPYEHGRIDRTLTLGDVEEWEITSNLAEHPFHIHVNPFQVIAILDEDGNDVTVEGTAAYDSDYDGVVGGWRDTLLIKRDYKVTMRTRYRRYIGDFVMHCHFASHGDAGMMQGIRMVMPGSPTTQAMMH